MPDDESRDVVSRRKFPAGRWLNCVFWLAFMFLPFFFAAGLAVGDEPGNSRRPNIVVILTDDQGFADISLNPEHPREVSTPHMDALAKDGVQFSQAYTSGHVCSPTRAGIMLGGYSQRAGVYTAGDGGRGFDPDKKIFPSYLPDEYVSAAIGKWHLGLDTDYPELKWHAMNRGFDECYKFMGRGGHSYFNLRSDSEAKFNHPIYRNKERINDEGYLTDRLTEEAVAFIDRNKSKPFFLYLAYNAVHAPAEAPEESIAAFQKKFPGLSQERAVLMAMLKHLDDGVGQVVGKLKQEGLFDNTLLFFLTDNGGSKAMSAINAPLRGFKGSLDEGGIRTPLIVSWPNRFPGGKTVDQPVISFDILPTVLQATEQVPASEKFDGKSLLPMLTGKATEHHPSLYWSKGPEDEWAIRTGDWKLHQKRGSVELIDLASDPSETKNVASANPAKVNELRSAYDLWIDQMQDPISGKPKRVDLADANSPRPPSDKQQQRTEKRANNRKMREAERKKKDKGELAETKNWVDVDSGTLNGKVMVGYQGWFNCPGDGGNLGWKHWAKNGRQAFAPGNVTIDLWPDVSELEPDERYATGFKHEDGSAAEVFSSGNRKTVLRHFRWMRDYGIDGAFLQRFASGLSRPASLKNSNAVLAHVREGARQAGRTYAVMYDLSELSAGQVDRVRADWSSLRSEQKVTSDPGYLHHQGKPLVAVWGIGFKDDRQYSLRECHDLVMWLKSEGCSVMLGVPSYWRDGTRDATDDPLLQQIIKLADVVSPWSVGRYRNPAEASRHADAVWRADRQWCDREQLDFLPVVFPGFSWHNLTGEPFDQIPRLQGEFFWSQVTAAKRVGCNMIYVAMFDEVDEGTAIFKCTNDPPAGDGTPFLTYDGQPSDHYLKLAGQAGELLRNEVSLADPAPTKRNPLKQKRPNVLFIVCDDLNTHVSTSGYSPIHTPTIQQLAENSMTFSHAYCQYPVCGPSRASFLYGLYPQSTGVLDNKVDIRQTRPESKSLPQLFKENGYWTASVGKVFHSTRHEPGEVAWHEFQRFENDELPRVAAARTRFESEHGSIEKNPNRKAWKEYLPTQVGQLVGQTPPGHGPSGLEDAQHKDGKNVRQVISWLEKESYGDQPFFITCGIQKPHVPFLAPQKYFDQYPLDSLVYQADKPELWESLPPSAMSKRYAGFGFELGVENDALRREYMQAYHACISFVDTQIGLLLATLQEKGLWEDTIVVFTSDHGYHLGDHFMWGKVTLFDIGTKVPFIVHVPGMTQAGSSSQAMVELVDIYPTLTELAGLVAPAEIQGTSLVPLLKNPKRPGQKKYAYSVVRRGDQLGYALRNQRWRYGKWPDGEELYNLTRDPDEKNNLANTEKQAERLGEFRELLKQKQAAARSQAVVREAPSETEVPR